MPAANCDLCASGRWHGHHQGRNTYSLAPSDLWTVKYKFCVPSLSGDSGVHIPEHLCYGLDATQLPQSYA